MGSHPWTLRTIFGDNTFKAANESYFEVQKFLGSQQNSPEAKNSLKKAMKSNKSAVDRYRKANSKNPNHGTSLIHLAALTWHAYRFPVETKPTDNAVDLLHEVITLSEEALTNLKDRNPKPESYPTLLANLAAAYREHFMKSADLYQAIRLYNDTCSHTESASRHHVEATMQIGITYWHRYCNLSNILPKTDEDVASAIQYLTNARDLCGNNHNDIRYTCLYNLALIYHHRFEKQERLRTPNTNDDLDKAIESYRNMLLIIPKRHARYAKGLWALPMLLFHRYITDPQKHGNDLEDAKKRAQDAIDHQDTPSTGYQHQQLTAVLAFNVNVHADVTSQSNIRFPSLTDADLYELTTFSSDPVGATVKAGH